VIEFKNVTKKYGNKITALSDVNLTIEKGEFVFVVGSSGAGKSTFLKLMMREEVPTSGTITVDGVNLNKIKRRQIPKFRRKLGVVFQDFRLISNMTVFNNVAFAMRVIGTKEKKIRRRVPYLLSLMGLSDKSRNYPRELSGGEQQRVALARALANDAEIIIADEPTGNVDPQMSYEIVDLLMRLNEAGTTVIMVTHEHSLVKCFDKRVIILDKGSVVSDGGILDHEAATDHINPISEMSSKYNAPGAQDYSGYAKSAEKEAESAEPEEVTAFSEDFYSEEASEETIEEENIDEIASLMEELEVDVDMSYINDAVSAPAQEDEASPASVNTDGGESHD
jgi:cell division transport system ATP-binding protein